MISGSLGPGLSLRFSWQLEYALSALLSTVYAVLWHVAAAVFYFELLQLKEAGGSGALAAVFD